MTPYAECVTKFDGFRKNIEPIKFHVRNDEISFPTNYYAHMVKTDVEVYRKSDLTIG